MLWSDNLATAQPLGALNSIADVRGQPVIDRDRVFAVSQSGLMVAIDLRTGDRVWEQDVGSTHAPWVAGDFVYVLANDNELVCLTRDGRQGALGARAAALGQDEEKKKDAADAGPGRSSPATGSSWSPRTARRSRSRPIPASRSGGWSSPDGVYVTPAVADKTLYVLTDEADLIALR